ncbi:hypothetical protein [Sporosarcina sp. FA9]|uniref:hypothetical protein n=1 Tax=Sporosarcina sp. FA9 TaxID=3413030 RepID=UPI003F65D9D0
MLFVDGPPVFIRVVVRDEESTSVFMMNEEELQESDEQVVLTENTNPEIDLSVLKRVIYLDGAFQRAIYKPLQFITSNEILKGSINKIEGETVFIDLHGENEGVVALEISSIDDILWRGHPIHET